MSSEDGEFWYDSSSSIGTATLVGFGLLNYLWVFSAGRFLQSAVASGTSNPQLGGPVTRTLQLPPPGVPHVWNDASEPQQRKVGLWARNCREFFRKWRLPRHFWVLLHGVNLRHGTDGFTSPPKEDALRIVSPEKSDGFGRVWTRELGYQMPAQFWYDECTNILTQRGLSRHKEKRKTGKENQDSMTATWFHCLVLHC